MIESQYASIYCNDFFKDNRRCLLGSCRLIPFKLNGNQACTFYLNVYSQEEVAQLSQFPGLVFWSPCRFTGGRGPVFPGY